MNDKIDLEGCFGRSACIKNFEMSNPGLSDDCYPTRVMPEGSEVEANRMMSSLDLATSELALYVDCHNNWPSKSLDFESSRTVKSAKLTVLQLSEECLSDWVSQNLDFQGLELSMMPDSTI
jgi:hypothetical protein